MQQREGGLGSQQPCSFGYRQRAVERLHLSLGAPQPNVLCPERLPQLRRGVARCRVQQRFTSPSVLGRLMELLSSCCRMLARIHGSSAETLIGDFSTALPSGPRPAARPMKDPTSAPSNVANATGITPALVLGLCWWGDMSGRVRRLVTFRLSRP